MVPAYLKMTELDPPSAKDLARGRNRTTPNWQGSKVSSKNSLDRGERAVSLKPGYLAELGVEGEAGKVSVTLTGMSWGGRRRMGPCSTDQVRKVSNLGGNLRRTESNTPFLANHRVVSRK